MFFFLNSLYLVTIFKCLLFFMLYTSDFLHWAPKSKTLWCLWLYETSSSIFNPAVAYKSTFRNAAVSRDIWPILHVSDYAHFLPSLFATQEKERKLMRTVRLFLMILLYMRGGQQIYFTI